MMHPHHRTCSHAVLFYQDEAVVTENVAAYVGSALRRGEPALVIAKPALRKHVALEVHRQHVQGPPFGSRRGMFVTMDAGETLAKFCIEGKPDAGRFREVLGSVLDYLSGPGKRVAAYGEMVGLLCERGQYADAVRLEAMWNELLETANASLFCGYAKALFESADAAPFGAEIRAAHAQVYG